MYNGKERKGAYTIDKTRMKVKGSSIILGAQIGCSKYIAVPVWQPFLNELNQAEVSPLKDNKMEWEGAWAWPCDDGSWKAPQPQGTFSCIVIRFMDQSRIVEWFLWWYIRSIYCRVATQQATAYWKHLWLSLSVCIWRKNEVFCSYSADSVGCCVLH